MQITSFLKIARAQFLLLGLALFLFGALVAVSFGAPFSPARLLLGVLIVELAQLSVHFSNDFFDADTDAPNGKTLISGGAGILGDHPELRETSRRIAIGLIVLSLGLGIFFVIQYDLPFWFLALVLAGNLAGWVYSAPPLRLAERGLGELCSILVIGFLVPVTGYMTLSGTIDAGILTFLFPVMLYGLVLILAVEIPDLESDRPAGKNNWIVRYGRRFGFLVVGLALLAATAYFFLFPALLSGFVPFNLRVIGWLSLLTLFPGLWGLSARPQERKSATQIATFQVITLAAFTVLVDGYLVLHNLF